MGNLLSDFRDNLEEIRKEHNLQQNQLSTRCGYDDSYIGKIERGSKDPSLSTVETIANELDVSAHTLFEPN